MRNSLSPATPFLIALILTGCQLSGEAPPKPVALAITDVTVIDPQNESVSPGQSVYIDQDRIVAVHPADSGKRYVPTTTIDGTGKYLIPGLMDMHVHTAHPQFSKQTLALLLANGVTGVREMSGDCWEPGGEIFACIDQYRELQDKIDSGDMVGPSLLEISSAPVKGEWSRGSAQVPGEAKSFVTPRSAAESRRLVNYLDDRGVDFIKIYNGIPRDAYFGLAERARSTGLRFAGHVPYAATSPEVSRAGQATIEHAEALPLDCSDYGSEYRRRIRALMDGEEDAEQPDDTTRLKRTLSTFDADLCRELLDTLAANDTYYVPTHVTREFEARAVERQYRDDPRMKYVMDRMKGFWRRDLENTASASPAKAELYRRFLEHGLKITRLAHETGVPIMAGTDANDTMMFPGFRLHDELALLQRAGLAPMTVLRTATSTPAQYLGLSDTLGGITPGKRADLVLLDADPMNDIANTQQITAVIRGGQVFERGKLNAMLEEVAEEAAVPWKTRIPTVEVRRETLASYAGAYRVPSSGMVVRFLLEKDGLKVTAEGMPVLDLYAKSKTQFFFMEDDTTFEFQTTDSGASPAVRVTHANGRSELASRIDR